MAKKLMAGGEIDGWCTKCKLDLSHRIIAMVGDMPKRVHCQTCGSDHNYYKPKTLPAQTPPKKPGRTVNPPRSSLPKSTASSRALAAAKAETDRGRWWEKSVSGHAPTAFKPYRVTSVFTEGELVHHTKFGDGVVMKILDRTKIEIMFREGTRTLAHGMEAS